MSSARVNNLYLVCVCGCAFVVVLGFRQDEEGEDEGVEGLPIEVSTFFFCSPGFR